MSICCIFLPFLYIRYFTFWLSSTVGSWLYSTTYPYFDTSLPNLVAPDNYTQTIVNIATNQTRYCGWNMTQEEGLAAGVPKEQSECHII